MMRFWFFLLLVLPGFLSAQYISSGPVVGGLASDAARIYVRTAFLQTFTLEVDTDPAFSNPLQFTDSTRAGLYRSTITELNGLQPATTYYYRHVFGGNADTLQGRFRTFPVEGQPGYYKLVVGSCNYGHQNDILFGSIRDFEPDMFLHLGDWNYAPSVYGWDYNLYPDKVADAFSYRFDDYNMSRYVLPYTAVDYMYDDDYSQNDCEGWSYPGIQQVPIGGGQIKYDLITNPMPAGIRAGAIKGYFDHFPGYPAIDTSAGVHHTFRMGNVEFFIVDTRMSKSPRHSAFQYDAGSNSWGFYPGPNHTTLGASQRAWLIDALKNSTADWKVIGSSVVFNRHMRSLLKAMVLAQLLDPANIEYASNLAYMWAGYPADTDSLMAAINDHQIKDVLMLSGDTHSSMMDNGSNAGIPELSSSGLAAGGEAILNWTIDSLNQSFNGTFHVIDSLWNGGGNGIGNQNFNDTYCTVEFFQTDSVRWCIIDELDQTIGCMTLHHSSLAVATEPTVTFPAGTVRLIYPNPAKDRLRLILTEGARLAPGDFARITDLNGRSLMELDARALAGDEINLDGLAVGTYLFVLHFRGELYSRKFVKH